MTFEETILSIQKSTITLEEIPAAKFFLENAIEECNDILRDPETELYSRREFQEKLTLYRKLLNRL